MRNRDDVDVVQGERRVVQGTRDHGDDGREVRPRRNLGDHATEDAVYVL